MSTPTFVLPRRRGRIYWGNFKYVWLGLEDKVKFFVSPALLNEYEAVLKRPRFKLGQKQIAELMGKINRKALIATPTKRLRIVKADEPDNRVLECGIKAKADFIITGNKRHFPFEEFKGNKIVTPREFYK